MSGAEARRNSPLAPGRSKMKRRTPITASAIPKDAYTSGMGLRGGARLLDGGSDDSLCAGWCWAAGGVVAGGSEAWGLLALSTRASLDEYLSHNIKSVYALTPPMGADDLLAELRKGAIYSFSFSYRGGLHPDTAFLLAGSDGQPFLCVGKKAHLQFVALPQAADPEEEAESPAGDDDEDSMDFGMM